MKTFGDLNEGDLMILYDYSGIVARKITSITKDGQKTRMIQLEGRLWPFRADKSLSMQNMLSGIYFACKNAAEEYLLQMERDERERHWNKEKKIQELREQYEKIWS